MAALKAVEQKKFLRTQKIEHNKKTLNINNSLSPTSIN
jgi:hypothetical protein